MPEKYLNYMESFPKQINEILQEKPIAYIPFGALEWHGEQNVLGVDSIKALEICKRCAEITGVVLFPCVNYGAFDTIKFPLTFSFKKRLYKQMTRKLVEQLYHMGFRIIILLTGHYPNSQIKQVKKVAQRISKKKIDCFALGIPEQKLGADLGYHGDHAASWETSIMMVINPKWVNLDLIPDNLNFAERAIRHGILGKDPKCYASKEVGENILYQIVQRLPNVVLEVFNSQSIEPFRKIYLEFQKVKRETHGLKHIFRIYGIGSRKEGWEYFKWSSFFSKSKKYNPKYQYPKDKKT